MDRQTARVAATRAAMDKLDARRARTEMAWACATARLWIKLKSEFPNVTSAKLAEALGRSPGTLGLCVKVYRRRKELPAIHAELHRAGITLSETEPYRSSDALNIDAKRAIAAQHRSDRRDVFRAPVDLPPGRDEIRLPLNGVNRLANCMDFLPSLSDGSIDLILTDPPHGNDSTQYAWDVELDRDALWPELFRVLKPNGVILLHGHQPFTSLLIASQLDKFRYCWSWQRSRSSAHHLGRYSPLHVMEEISVFSNNVGYTFNPQRRPLSKPYERVMVPHRMLGAVPRRTAVTMRQYNGKHPINLLTHRFRHAVDGKRHPTMKPVALLRYLLRTYSNAGDTILDFCSGYGSSAIAAIREGRKFVGCDVTRANFEIARTRIGAVLEQAAQSPPIIVPDELDEAAD
jgi:hypothetical protein